MGAIKAAVADGVMTFMWVICASSLRLLTTLVAGYIGLSKTQTWASLFITTAILFTFLFTFGIIGNLLGGATFNPTATAAFYAAGLDSSLSLLSAALRFPAQAAGAAGAALFVMEFMPKQYKHMLGGPSLKVDLHTGAIAEGVLTFIITFIVLLIVVRGPRNPLAKTALLATATISMVIAGSSYTGPSMNPANAFGWAYFHEKHKTWDHFYVYWICPFVGAIMAAWIFRAIFPPPTPKKQKKA